MRLDKLTDEHRTILNLYADGRKRKQIAGELGVSVSYIGDRTKELMRILEAHNRTHAVAVAWRAKAIL